MIVDMFSERILPETKRYLLIWILLYVVQENVMATDETGELFPITFQEKRRVNLFLVQQYPQVTW